MAVASSAPAQLSPWAYYLAVWLAVVCLAAWLHLKAVGLVDTPGQPPITLTQGITAALANTLEPWAGHAVRLVDFPGAGLRNFNLLATIGMTLAMAIMLFAGLRLRRRAGQGAAFGGFVVLKLAWYGYGFFLIKDGLL